MGIIVGDAVCGVIIYWLRLRRLLSSAAVFPVRSVLRVPLRAVSLRHSLHDSPVLRSRLPGSQTRLPARLRPGLPSSATRLPDRLSARLPAAVLPADNPCYAACRFYG